jgi:hypothetical protein
MKSANGQGTSDLIHELDGKLKRRVYHIKSVSRCMSSIFTGYRQ